MAESASTLDPIVAARIAALEALVAEKQAALDAERVAREAEQTAHLATKAERDRLREAYDSLTREVELARRRLIVAKAERVDTAQLELEFAAALAKLDALSRKAEEEVGEKPAGGERTRKTHKPRGRRDLRQLDLPEEHIAIPDPLLEGKAARIGTAEESVGVRWKRGGFVRVVFERVKYDATKPAMTAAPSLPKPSEDAPSGTPPADAPAVLTAACTPEELAATVASDPRTAGAVIVTVFVDTQHRRGMLRSALGYCRNQRAALMRFLDDGALEMTNNRSERQLRRIATGRQAWLFVGSDLHGTTCGHLLTLIASARLHRLDPEVYLRDVFRVLPHWPRDRYLELAPRYWRITRARLRSDELEQEVGWLTIPEPPLPKMPALNPVADAAAPAIPVAAP